jgi:hypothetical protein
MSAVSLGTLILLAAELYAYNLDCTFDNAD